MQWLGISGDLGIRKAMDYFIDGCLQEDGADAIELKGRMVKLPCHALVALAPAGLFLYTGYR